MQRSKHLSIKNNFKDNKQKLKEKELLKKKQLNKN